MYEYCVVAVDSCFIFFSGEIVFRLSAVTKTNSGSAGFRAPVVNFDAIPGFLALSSDLASAALADPFAGSVVSVLEEKVPRVLAKVELGWRFGGRLGWRLGGRPGREVGLVLGSPR